MKLKFSLLWTGLCLALAHAHPGAAQTPNKKFNLYEQTSETAGLIIQYGQDIRAVRYFYSPLLPSRNFAQAANVLNSPEQRKRLGEIDRAYLQKLTELDFDAMSTYGKVDYILLKRNIEDHQLSLAQEEQEYGQIARHLPFAEPIYLLEKGRRRGAVVDGQQVAGTLNGLKKEVLAATEALRKTESMDKPLADRAEEAITGLRTRLKGTHDFYIGYDPLYSWWVPAPYKALDSTLVVVCQIDEE